MMKEVIQAALDLKVPSIIILVIFGALTYGLLKNSPSMNSSQGIAGLIFLAVTIFSGTYAFLEHLIKERYESIIKIQQAAMEKLSKTHSVFEDNKQRTLTENLSSTQQQYTAVNPYSETNT